MYLLATLAWAFLAQVPMTTLSGIVVDLSGRPMAGAEVWLADQPWWYGPKPFGQVKADGQGRFSISRPTTATGNGPYMPVALWAYSPGHRLGIVTFQAGLPTPDEVIRIEVGPPAKAVIRLESPGPPGAIKGKVEVFSIHRRPGNMPRSLVQRLGVPIGDDGVATLDGFNPEDIQGLDARTEAFGTQTRNYHPPVVGDRTIRLRPVGHLSGKVVADDPSKVKGWKVSAWTTPDDEPGYGGTVGNYWTDTDDQGRFDFPTLPTGSLTIRALPPEGVGYVTDNVKGKKIAAGAKLEVDILVRRGVLVEGFVRELGTGVPMPGVSISLFPKDHDVRGTALRTDDQGRYSDALWPGQVTMHASGGPATHMLPPKTTGRTFEIPANVERFELPAIEMTRGASVRGVVLDAQGRPVANAAVEARYPGDDEGDLTRARANTRSDRSGTFLLQGITPGAEVKLSAKKPGEATAGAVTGRAGAEAAITLKLGPSTAIALKGRVLGPDGRPLPDALIQLKSKAMGNGPNSWGQSAVTFDGDETIRTGADGTFETPRELAPDLLYRAEVVAVGMARAQSDWVAPPSTSFPDLALRRSRALRSVAGRVVDRAGEPVAGVLVFQSGDGPRPTRSVTDAQGRFRVEGILDGRAFLFASKDRFRFNARPIGPGSGDVEIVLTRDLEQPTPLGPVALPMSRAEDKALARKLLERLTSSGDPSRLQALEARLDPDRTIELIQNQVLRADSSLAYVALGLIEDEPREALDLIESDRNDSGAASAYIQAFDALPSSQAGLRRGLLDRAERRARAAHSSNAPGIADQRAGTLARIADRWLDLGDRDRAIALLREARADTDAIPPRGGFDFSTDQVVKVLARVDLPAALAMLDRDSAARSNNPGYYQNILAEVAERAAEVDPAEAERLLKQIGQDHERKAAARQACYRMASRDLARARRIAETLDDKTLPPFLDVLAARSKVSTDPQAARSLLDSAFAEFGRLADAMAGGRATSDIPVVMAMCLPVVARVDPSLVPEYLARCLPARPNRTDEPNQAGLPMTSLLAMFLARYDRGAAEVVFEAVPEGLAAPASGSFGIQPNDIRTTIQAAAVFDPRAALAILDRQPEDVKGVTDPRWGEDRCKLEARFSLATSLSLPVDRRRIEALQSTYRLWPIGQLD
jgi:protocatechuate 3,4-dioxygenase beta subunit/tetratricopeptide (TPR) repeat protein